MFTGDTVTLARMMSQERTDTLLKEQHIWLLIREPNNQRQFYAQWLRRGGQWLQQQFWGRVRWPARPLNEPTAAAGGGD